MNTKATTAVTRMRRAQAARLSPLRQLTPEALSRQLDEFNLGRLGAAARTWELIERRDDVLAGVAAKRKKAVARLGWEVLAHDTSAEAAAHRTALETFYSNIRVTHALDANNRGGFSLLLQQMMDAVGKRYAVHEIVWAPGGAGEQALSAEFRFVPLWYFENTTGRLRFLENDTDTDGRDLEDGAWLVTTGDGLMEACGHAFLYKHLPLRDWLVYCERNGMPGVKAVTDALPGTLEWESAREAVEAFGAEYHAVLSRGTELEPIDMTSRGELPYQPLVERMDRVMISLWRGADLSTLSSGNSTGVSVQRDETLLLENHDAIHLSEILNAQVDRYVIQYLFGKAAPKASVRIKTNVSTDPHLDLAIAQKLYDLGAPLGLAHLMERFGFPLPAATEQTLRKPELRQVHE